MVPRPNETENKMTIETTHKTDGRGNVMTLQQEARTKEAEARIEEVHAELLAAIGRGVLDISEVSEDYLPCRPNINMINNGKYSWGTNMVVTVEVPGIGEVNVAIDVTRATPGRKMYAVVSNHWVSKSVAKAKTYMGAKPESIVEGVKFFLRNGVRYERECSVSAIIDRTEERDLLIKRIATDAHIPTEHRAEFNAEMAALLSKYLGK
jgi:hypothetical protein